MFLPRVVAQHWLTMNGKRGEMTLNSIIQFQCMMNEGEASLRTSKTELGQQQLWSFSLGVPYLEVQNLHSHCSTHSINRVHRYLSYSTSEGFYKNDLAAANVK